MNKQYTTNVIQFTKPGRPNTRGCNAVEFVNRGEAVAIVNGEQLQQNQATAYSGHEGESDETNYSINFQNTGGQSQLLFVKVKFYVK